MRQKPKSLSPLDEAHRLLAKAMAPARIGSRQAMKAQTRLAIRVAALTLFEAKGIANVTVEEIALHADISPRTFFNYFATKEECVMFPHTGFAAAFRAYIDAQPAELGVVSVIGDALTSFFQQLSKNNYVVGAIRQGALLQQREPSLRIADAAYKRVWEDVVQAALEDRGVPTMESRIAAIATIGAWKTSLLDWATSDGEESMSTAIQRGFSYLQTGFQAERFRPSSDPSSAHCR
jgi:AcrR family transcriptional regulator